jgi:predicted Ser/Thr protein kinase
MNTPSPDSPQSVCPKCGKPIIEGSPRGLCPLCLLSEVAKDDSPPPIGPDPELEDLRRAFPSLEIIELLGAGGMGRVYKVRQPHLDRFGALKLLPPGLAENPAWAERFTREARALARLNHPGIVQVYDFGEATTDGDQANPKKFPFLLMEYVDGVNLRQALRTGSLTAAEALAIVPPICAALQYAHEQGVLHRDIKPENILLDADGRVKIADFGVAKLAGSPEVPGGTLTATGAQLGTAAYMAPEQIERPQDVDHRADIYSLGVVFYELLTGELPLGRFLAPSEKAGTDPRLDTIVFRTLEKERDRRFQSAGEVKTEVEHVTSSEPPPMPSMPSPQVPAPASAVASRKHVALVLSLVFLPVVIVGLALLIPAIARSNAAAGMGGVRPVGVLFAVPFIILLSFVGLMIAGFTWLFRRLRRGGYSTGVAVVIVAIGLMIIPPAGCVALLVPAYVAHRRVEVRPEPKPELQVHRNSTSMSDREVTAHWSFSSRVPMWITAEFRGAKRTLQLAPRNGQYGAELDIHIMGKPKGFASDMSFELGNGQGKAGGSFGFVEPPAGWLERVFQGVADSRSFPPGKITLAKIGSDVVTLQISRDAPDISHNSASFTLKSVSVHNAEGSAFVSIDYVEDVVGDAELYFQNHGLVNAATPDHRLGIEADRTEVRKSCSWRLSGELDEAARSEVQTKIESQYLGQTIEVPSGQLWQFFQATTPDGKVARVYLGARFGKR